MPDLIGITPSWVDWFQEPDWVVSVENKTFALYFLMITNKAVSKMWCWPRHSIFWQVARAPGPVPGIGTKITAVVDPDGYKTVIVDEIDIEKELEEQAWLFKNICKVQSTKC